MNLDFLSGYKTKIGAAGFALVALYYLLDGNMIEAGKMASLAIGLLGLRMAIEKAAPPVLEP